MLASSNAENEGHFNPLKQSQILTKDKKAPNFAQSMPSQTVFKNPNQGSKIEKTSTKLAAQSSAGKPPTHHNAFKQHQQLLFSSEPYFENQVTLQDENHFRSRESNEQQQHLHSSSLLPNNNNSLVDMCNTPSFDPGSKLFTDLIESQYDEPEPAPHHSQFKRDQKEETNQTLQMRQSANELHHLSTIRQDELLSRLNLALTEMQETVRANEALRAENRSMSEQIATYKTELESRLGSEQAQTRGLQHELAEATQKMVIQETENQLLRQQLKEAELRLQLSGQATHSAAMQQAQETAFVADQFKQQLATLQGMLNDKQQEVDAYKDAVEESDKLLQKIESESTAAIEQVRGENLDL